VRICASRPPTASSGPHISAARSGSSAAGPSSPRKPAARDDVAVARRCE
jgi:hypothetical protein